MEVGECLVDSSEAACKEILHDDDLMEVAVEAD